MAASLEDLTTKFEAFDLIMQHILDKVFGLESWQTSARDLMDALLLKADDTPTRLQRLESAPPPPPPPPHQSQLPPPPPPSWVNPFDLSLAPGQPARPSASASERPNGHRQHHGPRDAGGILGSPPHLVMGMSTDPPPPICDPTSVDTRASSSKFVPK